MQVSPPQPCSAGERAEDRMWRPFEAAVLTREHVDQGHEIRDVGSEVSRTCAAGALLDLRSRWDPGRPRPGGIQRNPLDDRPLDATGCGADAFLTDSHPEPVAEVAHHLVCRHPAPAMHAVGPERVEPFEELCLVARLRQSVHQGFGCPWLPKLKLGPTYCLGLRTKAWGYVPQSTYDGSFVLALRR